MFVKWQDWTLWTFTQNKKSRMTKVVVVVPADAINGE